MLLSLVSPPSARGSFREIVYYDLSVRFSPFPLFFFFQNIPLDGPWCFLIYLIAFLSACSASCTVSVQSTAEYRTIFTHFFHVFTKIFDINCGKHGVYTQAECNVVVNAVLMDQKYGCYCRSRYVMVCNFIF